jgi:hypothetical protein
MLQRGEFLEGDYNILELSYTALLLSAVYSCRGEYRKKRS